MSVSKMNWGGFYRIAGATAVILLLYSLVTMAILVTLGGMPATAREGFDLLAKNRLVGLLRLDALTILAMLLYYLLLLGLFGALKEVDRRADELLDLLDLKSDDADKLIIRHYGE